MLTPRNQLRPFPTKTGDRMEGIPPEGLSAPLPWRSAEGALTATKRYRCLSIPFLLSLVAASAGCGPSSADKAVISVRDSAGITVIDNAVGDSLGAAILRLEVRNRIGVVEGDEPFIFSSIVGAGRLRDGSVVVGDARTREIRVFDSLGRHVRSFGGSGGGPGEFSQLSSMSVSAGDTVIAWDVRTRRQTMFLQDGTVVKSIPLQKVRGFILDMERLVSGDQIATTMVLGRGRPPQLNQEPGIILDSIAIIHLDSVGNFRDTLAVLAHNERAHVSSVGSGAVSQASIARPFGFRTHLVVKDSMVVFGPNTRYEVFFLQPGAGLGKVVRSSIRPGTITQAELGRVTDHLRKTVGESPIASNLAEVVFDIAPPPEKKPAFGALKVTNSGGLWVGRYHYFTDSISVWDVFDEGGRYVGYVRSPTGLEILEIDADYLVGVRKDDFDVPFVYVFTLIPGELN